ncbi:MAG TPA: pitrilysin family protein [Bacteroidota bacterium]|nr:pitrilysin family protein [Bacteroidota bacterium]
MKFTGDRYPGFALRASAVLLLAAFVPLSLCYSQNLSVKFEKFTLPNGLTVIMHEDHSVPIVSVNVWYHVGSCREKPGRTGFAHLFEHIMFEGSQNVPPGEFDKWLEAAGGDNNGSTTTDRTNYWENVPSNALELCLFLESDRMGFLLPTMSEARVNQQRDVVKNEKRQSFDNQLYGQAEIIIPENLFPPDHPYHWNTIGSMEDLTAATHDDVADFFKKYYVPSNASLAIAGDIDPVKTKEMVTRWFSDVPAQNPVMPLGQPPVYMTAQKRLVNEDNVELPRLYLAWATPAEFAPGDAELDVLSNVLAGGKNSRLYKRLVYDMQIAQDVEAFEQSGGLASQFYVIATARPGHTLTELESVIWEEINKVKADGPTKREVDRAVNGFESGFLDRLEAIGGFGGKADQLNQYYTLTGSPDFFNQDLARYKSLAPDGVQSICQKYLREDGCVILSVVPKGKTDLAAQSKKEGK